MLKKHPENERIKLQYFDFLKHADGKAEQTIRQVEKAISRFEAFSRTSDFRTFDQKQAISFKLQLLGSGLALATVLKTINVLKRFLGWLATQPGYKRRISVSDIGYLSLSEKNARAATAPSDKAFPSLLMVEKVVSLMPGETPMQLRDRALIALVALTGIRDGAVISLKLKHFHEERRLILQDPREVTTKFSKRIDSFLLPLNDIFEPLLLAWVRFLKQTLLFGDADPIFPKTATGHDQNACFLAVGLSREHWADASPVRTIFSDAFKAAGLPAFTPHTFRDMIIGEAYRRKLPPNELKAWSQNLGHEGLLITLTSYGKLSLAEQGQLIRKGEIPDQRPLTRSELEKILLERGL